MGQDSRLAFDNKLLTSLLRARDPGQFASEPLAPGAIAAEVTIDPTALVALVQAAAASVCGLGSGDVKQAISPVLWREGDSELLLGPAFVSTRLADGIVAFTLPVICDQAGSTEVHVSFVVGSPKRPAGLIAATEERPRGPAAVVDVWGDRLTAFAWRVLLELIRMIAAGSGRDQDGAPLVPVAMSASANGLTVVPMARHPFDRIAK
ncbi:hypothetical protein BH11PSE8_BH11PSE8_41440 [soil metagenome]